MMKYFTFPALGALVASSLALPAVPVAAQSFNAERQRYDDCVALVRQNAAAAFSSGLDWADSGGGVAAKHCTGLALSALGKDEGAGDMFMEAAGDAIDGRGVSVPGMQMTAALIAALLTQAGNSYILAQLPGKAIAPFSNALDQLPLESRPAIDLLIDRARAYALSGDHDSAFADLSQALDGIPNHLDGLLLRANAARRLDDLETAKTDIEKLITLRPDMAAAWLERGQIAEASGAPDLARQSYQRALELEDDGPTAQAARMLLEQLAM